MYTVTDDILFYKRNISWTDGMLKVTKPLAKPHQEMAPAYILKNSKECMQNY